jgi:WD40 repeat protein
MITWQKLFHAENSMEIVVQHVVSAPPRPKSIIPDLPIVIEEIILKALSKEAETRYQSMEDFAQALREAQESVLQADQKPGALLNYLRSRSSLVILAVSLFVVGALVFWGYTRSWIPSAPIAPEKTPAPTLESNVRNPVETNESEPTATPTIQAVPSPTSTPFPVQPLALESISVLPGTKIPASKTMIDRNNVSTVVEVARLGIPDIHQLAFVRNDELLLAATSAGMYYIDPSNLLPKYFFDVEGIPLTFAISADGEWVATGDSKGIIALWNLADGSEIARFAGDAGPIKSVDFSPDKSKLVFSATDKAVHILDLEQKVELFVLKKHTLNINKVAFSPDGGSVISGGDDFQIMIWDAQSGEFTRKYSAAKKINDLSISSDGSSVAVALNNATVEIWDLRQGTLINTIKDAQIVEPFTFIDFLPNNQLVLTGSSDGSVRVWNALGPERIWETSINSQSEAPTRSGPIKTIAVSKSGTKFVVMSEEGTIEVWDLSNQEVEVSQRWKYQPIERLAISPNDQLLAIQAGSVSVEIWSLLTNRSKTQFSGEVPRGNPFSPDSQNILIYTGNLDLYSLTTLQQIFTFYDFPIKGSVRFLLDSELIAASSNSDITYWSTSSGRELLASSEKRAANCRVIYRRDGSLLAAGSANGIIDSEKNLEHFCNVPRGTRTTSEDFLPDGSLIALSLENQTVELWDLRSGGQKITLKGESPGDMLDVAVSPNGELLAAASASGKIEIYDLASTELIQTLDLHSAEINRLLFSNDGKYIISGSTDGTVRLFGLYP